jgi:hypothetical protein
MDEAKECSASKDDKNEKINVRKIKAKKEV